MTIVAQLAILHLIGYLAIHFGQFSIFDIF